jgi:nucleotide-binding universal stress UspA family protein
LEEIMLNTILIPFDGSVLAERAFPYATALARAGGARLILLHVRSGSGGAIRTVADLETVADTLRDSGVTVEPELYAADRGEIGRAICQAALEWQAELIVMTTHGRGGPGRLPYGTVADEVLREATLPVLLVSSQREFAWPLSRAPRILVPLDGSALAEEVLDPVDDLAEALGAELVLLKVLEPPPQRLEAYAPEVSWAHVTAERAEARYYLEIMAKLIQRAEHRVAVRATHGSPATAIAEIALMDNCDLIAMATHGRGGLAGPALGSVATGVLQQTGIPLLLTRPAGTPRAASKAPFLIESRAAGVAGRPAHVWGPAGWSPARALGALIRAGQARRTRTRWQPRPAWSRA